MKLYLSSFRVGHHPERLIEMVAGRTLGLIPNALDYVPPPARDESNRRARAEVEALGITVASLDLTDYFGLQKHLETDLRALGGVWVRGGNAFVLRQAMRLSGFDVLLERMVDSDFVYAGYSAGACVLAPSLEGIQHVDDPTVVPYESSEPIMEGLGLLDYLVLPHFRSDHPESEAIEREVAYCESRGIKTPHASRWRGDPHR